MSKQQSNQETTEIVSPEQVGKNKNGKSVFLGISFGILFGGLIGAAVGIFLRPKDELTELSQEWLEDLKDVADHLSGTVRDKVTDLVSKRHETNERYEEYPGAYV